MEPANGANRITGTFVWLAISLGAAVAALYIFLPIIVIRAGAAVARSRLDSRANRVGLVCPDSGRAWRGGGEAAAG